MKKIFRSVAALAVVMFAGCTTEIVDDNFAPAVDGNTTVVTFDLGESRTSLGELDENNHRKVLWSTGDKIAINGVTSAEAVISEENPSKALFSFDSALVYPYNALYPAAFYKDDATITLPATQGVGVGTFATNTLPMAAHIGEGEAATLHHVAGALRFRIKQAAAEGADAHEIHHVEFRGNNGEQLSGDFAIDYTNLTLTSASEAEADKVVATKVYADSSKEEDLNVFVVVPARTYERGFTLRIIDKNGHYMDVKSEISQTIAKGEIKAMPSVEFVPTGTLVNVEIKSAADLVAFAKEYNTGKYSTIAPFVVNIAEDIVFDDATNAEWEPIGNALSDESTNYFHGILEGNNHLIKNWKTSHPLFAYTGSGSLIKDLTIDASCVLTANFADGEQYTASFVGYHRGVLYNCANNAAIVATGSWSKDAYVAGLAGRVVVGEVENCSMNGSITIDENFKVAGAIYVGGLVGRVSNADGKITNSHFTNGISFAGGSSDSSKKGYIGGIVGYTAGAVKGCTSGTGMSIVGAHATNYIHTIYWGGIAGYVYPNTTISECVNNSIVKLTYQRNSDATRNLYMGGIAGYVDADAVVKSCNNAAEVQSRSACKTISIGGIVGLAVADSTIDDCNNTSTVSARSSNAGSNGGRYLSIGGIIGACATSNVSNVLNSGTIAVSKSENNLTANLCMGGCIGELLTALDGKNTVANSGKLEFTDTSANRSFLGVGGVVGVINKAGANLSNVSNSGAITDSAATLHTNAFIGGVVGLIRQAATVSGVTNNGQVHFANVTKTHVNLGLGGIIGGVGSYAYDTNNSVVVETLVTAHIDNAINNGKVVITKNGVSPNFAGGGIVGIIKGAGSSVINCENRAHIDCRVSNNGYNDEALDTTIPSQFDASNVIVANTSATCAAGIAGFALGTEGAPLQITNCKSTDTTNPIQSYRGYTGGIVGYARYAAIADCSNVTTVSSANTSNRCGGIAGYIHSSTITNSTATCTVDGVKNTYSGGIAGGMNATSTISSSKFNGKVTASGNAGTKLGAIVAYSAAGATITDCGAKGQIGFTTALASITVDAFCGDDNATITGSYILE